MHLTVPLLGQITVAFAMARRRNTAAALYMLTPGYLPHQRNSSFSKALSETHLDIGQLMLKFGLANLLFNLAIMSGGERGGRLATALMGKDLPFEREVSARQDLSLSLTQRSPARPVVGFFRRLRFQPGGNYPLTRSLRGYGRA